MEKRPEAHPNEFTTDTATPKCLLFLPQFRDVLGIIAATISFAIGSFREGTVMVVIVVVNALIGFVQKYRVRRIPESLRQLIQPPAKSSWTENSPRSRGTSSCPATSSTSRRRTGSR